MGAAIMLKASGLCYAGIIHDLSMTLFRGEMVALIGPNGAGKSTLLKLLAHIAAPEIGEVLLQDAPIRRMKAKRRAQLLGYLPQQTVIDAPYTVRDILEMGAYARATPLAPIESARILATVGLTEFADRDVRYLSGGERQRAFLGKVLAQDAQILLLDEPVSGLDIAYQIDILEICRTLVKEEKRTVLITLHDPEWVLRYADSVLLMQQGRIVARGRPAEVLTGAEMESAFGVTTALFADPVTGAPRLSLSRAAEKQGK